MKILLIKAQQTYLDLKATALAMDVISLLYKMMTKYGHTVVIGTTIMDKHNDKLNMNYELIDFNTTFESYDRIVVFDASHNYIYPPYKELDDKKRLILVLSKSNCPVIFMQDECVLPGFGYPADIRKVKHLNDRYVKDKVTKKLKIIGQITDTPEDLHKGRPIRILMQCKYPEKLSYLVDCKTNKYMELPYEQLNWGVQGFVHGNLSLEPKLNPEHDICYIGYLRKGRSRLELINDERAHFFGRWPEFIKTDEIKAKLHNKKIPGKDLPGIYNNYLASIWCHDDAYNFTVETARLYEIPKYGCTLLIDETMLYKKTDCYLYGLDCFYSTKEELWDLVDHLRANPEYRVNLIKKQQQKLKEHINFDRLAKELNDIILKEELED